MYYLNAACPVCGQAFTENDDVVVCPVCGTPHHRDCYQHLGHCFNETLHSQGYEWEGTVNTETTVPDPNQETQPLFRRPDMPGMQEPYYGRYQQADPYQDTGSGNRCMFCGYEVADDARFCNICGRPIIRGEIDGIPVEEWGRFLGRTAAPVLAAFKNQDEKHKKRTLYLPLLIVPEVFLLHRRLWLEFLVYELIGGLLAIPAMVIYASELGATTFSGLTSLLPMATWTTLMTVCAILIIAVRVCLGLFGLWYYRKWSVRKIQRIRSLSTGEEEYSARLLRSQPTMIPVYILLGLYVFYLFSSFR